MAKATTPKPAAAKPAAPKKAAAPKTAAAPKKAPGSGADGAHKTVTPSAELAAVIGKDAVPRTQVVSKLWEYIKKNDLQNPKDKREIMADDKLEKVFGKKKVSMFEMNKHVSAHLK